MNHRLPATEAQGARESSSEELKSMLERTRTAFSRLVALSSDWYWEADEFGRVANLSGRQSFMTVGSFLLEGVHAEDDDRAQSIRSKMAAGSVFKDIEFRVKDVRASGNYRWVSCSGEPITAPSGEVIGYRGLGRDVHAKVAEKQGLWNMANLDTLTGLPNRMKFTADLDAAVKACSYEPFALALIDLDHFKSINDTYGHDAGDELLTTVADRLRNALRSSDTVARLGGDEFAIIIRGVESGHGLYRPLDALISAMVSPINVGNQALRCTLSIGVSMCPSHTVSSAEVLKNADLAMYESKAAGRSQYTIFHSDMRKAVDRKNRLSKEVVEALDNDQLSLHYQPIMDVRSNRVDSVEALLRWSHPERGLLTAGQFHEAFEKTVIAQRIGRFVTDAVLADAANWLRDGLEFGRVAINVTTADFSIGDYPAWLASCMSRHGVPAERICIEVTEGMFLGSKATQVIEGLHALFGMGVQVAFDDYGTGYASLMHLRMPINRVKIDRIFARGIEDDATNQAIVGAIVRLSTDLGKGIVIEGVETPEQMNHLLSIGCSVQQGFGLAVPMVGEDLARFIKSRQA